MLTRTLIWIALCAVLSCISTLSLSTLTSHAAEPATEPATTSTKTPAASTEGDASIFTRFDNLSELRRRQVIVLQYPLPKNSRLNNDPQARLENETGFSLWLIRNPRNRIYSSSIFQYANLRWRLSDPRKNLTVEVRQYQLIQLIHLRGNWPLDLHWGWGLGLLDASIRNQDDVGVERLQIVLPIALGTQALLGERVSLSAQAIQTLFFGHGPNLSNLRLLAGLGYTF